MILTDQQLAFARATATNIVSSLGVRQLDAEIDALRAGQRQTETNWNNANEAADQAEKTSREARERVSEREAAILAGLTNAGGHVAQQAQELKGMIKARETSLTADLAGAVESAKAAVKDREDELQQAVVEARKPVDPAQPDGEQELVNKNQNQRNAAFTQAKKTDEELAKRKEAVKAAEAILKGGADKDEQIQEWRGTLAALESAKVDLSTAGARALALKQHGTNDEELIAATAALKVAEEAERAARTTARAWRVELNALNRDFNLLCGRQALKASIIANLGGFELAPVEQPIAGQVAS